MRDGIQLSEAITGDGAAIFRLAEDEEPELRAAVDMRLALADHAGPCLLRPVMELGDWLRSLGLERYEAVFRENAIDPDVLCDLTEEHLRELGVPLGARLKLLKAIVALAAGKEPKPGSHTQHDANDRRHQERHEPAA